MVSRMVSRVVSRVCPSCPMSMVSNVYGVKCPWCQMSMVSNVYGVKCPWCPMSMVSNSKCGCKLTFQLKYWKTKDLGRLVNDMRRRRASEKNTKGSLCTKYTSISSCALSCHKGRASGSGWWDLSS